MGDSKVHQYVKLLTLNEDLVGNPDKVLSKLEDFHNNSILQESQPNSLASELISENPGPFKMTHYCANMTRRESSPIMQDLIIDCGATHHMFNKKNLFLSLTEIPPMKVSTGDSSSTLAATGLGTVKLICHKKPLILENCLFVPELNCSLFSLLQLFDEKLVINWCRHHFTLESKGLTIVRGSIINNLMKVKYSTPKAFLSQVTLNHWHQQLGHPGPSVLRLMGLPIDVINCQTCELNKAHLLPFKSDFEHVSLPLDCVHIDLFGPITPPSISGF
ncbi:hypothetical protein O181_014455 [Austropuccinia psidii MF-1]|uniref:Retrovirus-related Pol polyprotein from transposon TNT 1-94-like beta-barrel domain-containing protein n=1 Tax=Austropuccinia psidii MF-1 TaxID=1389203 RepID=A0A9Q3C100_9BASI|nr:hypothetical protein [Austropuccinia psidii MF-1]